MASGLHSSLNESLVKLENSEKNAKEDRDLVVKELKDHAMKMGFRGRRLKIIMNWFERDLTKHPDDPDKWDVVSWLDYLLRKRSVMRILAPHLFKPKD